MRPRLFRPPVVIPMSDLETTKSDFVITRRRFKNLRRRFKNLRRRFQFFKKRAAGDVTFSVLLRLMIRRK